MNGLKLTGTIAQRALLVIALAATFAVSAMVTIYLLFQAGEVKVPNIVGMSQDDARRAIEAAGLNYKIRRQHFDEKTPTGAVTEQDPIAGFPVKTGFDVKIDISKGPDPSGAPPVEETPPPGPPPANQNTNQEKKKKKPDNANANANSNSNAGTNSNKKPEAIDPKTGKPVSETNKNKANDNKPKPPAETPKPTNKAGDTPKEKDPEKAKKPPPPKIPPHD